MQTPHLRHDPSPGAADGPTVLCAWCDAVVITGGEQITRAMCAGCLSLLETGSLSDELRLRTALTRAAGSDGDPRY